MFRFLPYLGLILLGGSLRVAAAVDFARDIEPLFDSHCQKCHGEEKQKSEFRLDRRANLLRGGESGEPAVVPGNPDASYLLTLVAEKEGALKMPPEGEPLSADEITLLQEWIASGAPTPEGYGPAVEAPVTDHWSFQPVTRAGPPANGFEQPIDAFIAEKLQEQDLSFNPPAAKRILLRRMFLDVTGLLPTPEEQARLLDLSASALADHLLASPHYGERWARHWLDVVRFAESAGFETNHERPNAYHYRDYVIRAFNDDKPYDRFVFEQIAGDAVGEDAATGFIVGGAFDRVKGKDPLLGVMQRQDELSDMVNTTGTAFLGLTMGCAKCHNHKFDPVSQADFFALQSVFAGVRHAERPLRGPDVDARMQQAAAKQKAIRALRVQLDKYRPVPPLGDTVYVDDTDEAKMTHLAEKRGHGSNPAGTARGFKDDGGGTDRLANLSGGTYTWWTNEPGKDVFAYKPGVKGAYRLWLSWGCGWSTHSTDARYVLDRDGDPETTKDQQEIASIDQQRFADGSGDLPSKPLWSGFYDAGVHEFSTDAALILRGGAHGTAITADAIVLQAPNVEGLQPRLQGPVDAAGNEDRFSSLSATGIRFTIEATNNGIEPCIDELEVWTTNGVNIAATAIPTSSGSYTGNPKHQLKHINDGQFGNGRSWISNESGKGWVQLDWVRAEVIHRITWARDREKKYVDRLPVTYHVEVRNGVEEAWKRVASSASRVASKKAGEPIWDFTALPPDEAAAARGLLDQVKRLEKETATLVKKPMVYAGSFAQPGKPTRRLFRGDPLSPREVVAPDGMAILQERLGSFNLSADAPEKDRRMALANWIIHPENPLTARVMVNRIWHYHFGRGLVQTPSDFGAMGFRPTHPELLDWLAVELMENDWSLKHIHRLILNSQTYAQSSAPREKALGKDAGCRWLWRFPPRRLEAEAIRDNMLLVAGTLDRKMYGPGYLLFEPNANYSRNWIPKQQFGPGDYRRMIYALKLRMEQDAVFGVFDCPDAGSIAPARSRSTTPIQALNLYNSSFVLDQARQFAARVTASEASEQVHEVFQLAFGRRASEAELDDALTLLEAHGLAALCRALFNANEFLFIP